MNQRGEKNLETSTRKSQEERTKKEEGEHEIEHGGEAEEPHKHLMTREEERKERRGTQASCEERKERRAHKLP